MSQAEKKALEAEARRLTMLISEMQSGGGGETSINKDGMADGDACAYHHSATSEDILKALQEKDVS